MTELTLPADAPESAIPLPAADGAKFRDPLSIVQGDREDILEAITKVRDDETVNRAVKGMRADQALISCALDSWSLAEPLPTPDDLSSFRLLPLPVYDALAEGVKEFSSTLFPKTGERDPKDTDREGPTGPSSD